MNGVKYYLPFEFEPVSQGYNGKSVAPTPMGPGCWFTYSAGSGRRFLTSAPFPPGPLADWIKESWKRGAANVLLSCAPDHTGRMRPEDAAQFREVGKLLGLAPK